MLEKALEHLLKGHSVKVIDLCFERVDDRHIRFYRQFLRLLTLMLVAQMNQDKVVADGIRSLSELLKNTLINDHEFITIGEEIANLKHYFSIQTIRYA